MFNVFELFRSMSDGDHHVVVQPVCGIPGVRLCCTIYRFNGKCAGYLVYGCVVQFIDSTVSVQDTYYLVYGCVVQFIDSTVSVQDT